VLVSLQPEGNAHPHAQPRLSVLLALGAAFGFGMFFIFLDRGSAVANASPLWAVAGARISSLLTLLSLIAARPGSAPWVGSRFPAVAAIGVVDTVANVLFAFASTQGHLAIVSVLGSLYPVATVLLGRIILSERLNHVQHAGIVLALSGVALLSAG
jgi:drug/metabolite transporter (DMT)-like permease